MRPEARWRARTLRPRSAASSGSAVAEPPRDWHEHLGRKVSIRYRLDDDRDYRFSEAIGVVQAVGPDGKGDVTVTILSRRGDVVTVRAADVLAAKIFPS